MRHMIAYSDNDKVCGGYQLSPNCNLGRHKGEAVLRPYETLWWHSFYTVASLTACKRSALSAMVRASMMRSSRHRAHSEYSESYD